MAGGASINVAGPASSEPLGARPGRLTRNDVVKLFGTPDETVGSVNEPRILNEGRLAYNEKWTYNAPRRELSRPLARYIFWLRYDFVASERVERDGTRVRETEAELLARLGS
jgi:hypothetical protein